MHLHFDEKEATVATMAETERPPDGIGSRVRRKEDARHLRGAGQFVADISLPGMKDIAFVRSPAAHGRLTGVRPPQEVAPRDFWTAAELEPLARGIVSDSGADGFRSSEYPLLAKDRVRFVGEPIAAVLAESRARAEDLAERVEVEIQLLEAIVDPLEAMGSDSPRIRDEWPDNVFLRREADFGDVDAAARESAVCVTREYRMHRQCGVPLETRGAVAYLDRRLDQVVLYSTTQFPHVIRTALAAALDIEERRLRVVAPDIGGGFGTKNNLYPEEIILCAMALQLPYPVRWIEDRWENLVGSAQARDHWYRVTAHASSEGEILGLEADIVVDAGAYSVWPWTAAMEAGMASGMVPGPYRIRNYRYSATTVATNKVPLGPYRGVARPGACFAIERTIDEVARELGLDAKDVRIRNMVGPSEFPYTSVTNMVYDSGDYPESVRLAAELVGHARVREEQRGGEVASRLRVGLGYASYTEQTAHGTAEWASRRLPVVFGFESATASLDPSGSLSIRVGIQSHGQGLETSLAQIASEVLGIPAGEVSVFHGDTATAPYGMGTFGSRSIVMGGGAVHGACTALAARVKEVGAGILDCEPDDVELKDGKVSAGGRTLSLAEVSAAAYLHVDRLPRGAEPALECTYRYQAGVDTGTFSYATHAAVVEVDLDSGHVGIRDYVVVEDCGTVVNPLIVEGQICGGVAQGVGTALYEEAVYDESGQPRATTFMDYLLPGATEVPTLKVGHLTTPSPHTLRGIKGMGEGSAIAPPAAVANAVADALSEWNVRIGVTPLTPIRVWTALEKALDQAGPAPGDDPVAAGPREENR